MKILIFDIETSMIAGYAWQKYEADLVAIKEDWYMLSFACKWLGDQETRVYALPDFKGYRKGKSDDYKLVKKLWEYLDEADAVITQNGDAFDCKKANARFIFHGLAPPSSYQSIDTLKIARKHFNFTSNKLDDLGNYLGVGRKIVHTGINLWLGCLNGDMKAWKQMKKYNKQDVILTERVYKKLLPYIQNHPNRNIYQGTKESCPSCGSDKTVKRGFKYNRTGKHQQWQCLSCYSWSSGNKVLK